MGSSDTLVDKLLLYPYRPFVCAPLVEEEDDDDDEDEDEDEEAGGERTVRPPAVKLDKLTVTPSLSPPSFSFSAGTGTNDGEATLATPGAAKSLLH